MPGELAIPIFVVVLALILVGVYYAHQQQLRRVAELRALGARLGWQFDQAKDAMHDQRYSHFGAFVKGHSRHAYNTLRGSLEIDGRPWLAQAGDYHYQITSHDGKQTTTHTHRFSYAIIETPHLGAPDLSIRREGLFDRFAGFLGFDDIDFESNEFSERFHVKSSNKRFAYAVIDPRMMEFLLDNDPPAIEFRRGQCCLVRSEKCWAPEGFAATLDWAREFFARWPKQVASVLEG
jgi:hypothetical protein